MARLTKRHVDSLEPAERDYIEWDGELPGFGLRVLPSGRKTFVVQYRAGGRTRRIKLGRYGVVTADQARTLARQRLGEVAHGDDPADAIARHRRAPTVARLCERFLIEHVALHCKPSTATEYSRSVDLFIKPAFGTRKVGEITRADVAELHHKQRHIPYQSNRTLGVLSKMFNLAEVWGLRPDGSNPTRHVKRYKERKHERYLSRTEIATLGQVLDEREAAGLESPYAVAAFRLLLLTGCRLREIQTLKWENVEGRYIVLPDAKTGPRKVVIAPAVREVLDRIKRRPDNPYVIAGLKSTNHLTDLQRPWRRIRQAAGLEDVRIHDLRHTYASMAISAGHGIEMVGKLLGHTQVQTTARYAHLADDPVRDAADDVASDLSEALASRPQRQPAAADRAAGGNKVVRFPGS